MKLREPVVIFWFRRDLRLEDNTGLWSALTSGYPVLPLFIYDENILEKLDRDDRRMGYLKDVLERLNSKLIKAGSSLFTVKGKPDRILKDLLREFEIKAVYYNNDYEPYATQRDEQVGKICAAAGIPVFASKDQVIFEKSEILKADGKPYTVYTPYSRQWMKLFNKEMIKEFPSTGLQGRYVKTGENKYFPPSVVGFSCPQVSIKPFNISTKLVGSYDRTRDYPSVPGTSNLSLFLRFGTISIREVLRRTWGINNTFVSELIWREFFMQILWHFPYVAEASFRRKYDRIEWVNNEEYFQKWCEGMTGFPIVDAGMRELKETGYMHNRVRMITANFLTRILLTDWRWGEAWFAAKLLDFELSSNNGNWQWAAGTGCDAAPYFRIFNPESQQLKFDQNKEYIRRWIPEYGTNAYPEPLVNLQDARQKALAIYKSVLES